MKNDRDKIIAKILLILSIMSFGITVYDGIKLCYDVYFKDSAITFEEITDKELKFIIEAITSLAASGALLGINDAFANEDENETEKSKELVK